MTLWSLRGFGLALWFFVWGGVSVQAACEAGAGPWLDLKQVAGFEAPLSHPLIGQVFDARAGRVPFDGCPEQALGRLTGELRGIVQGAVDRPSNARMIVLGEVHDNPAVHALRGKLLEAITRKPVVRVPALVFEQLRVDQQPVLDVINADVARGMPPSLGQVFDKLEWSKSGWPEQTVFEPIFGVALAAAMPMYAGDPSRTTIRDVAKQGAAALPVEERARLRLDAPLGPDLQNDLLSELEASHCGLMPKQAFGNMAVAQRYRDAMLASALANAAQKNGAAILLAGNGHARRDRGVPSLFGPAGLAGTVTSVMLLEVEDGKTDGASYVPRGPDGKAAVDIVVFVPRFPREDPCVAMRKQFEKAPAKR